MSVTEILEKYKDSDPGGHISLKRQLDMIPNSGTYTLFILDDGKDAVVGEAVFVEK